jgi:hypothetical protein
VVPGTARQAAQVSVGPCIQAVDRSAAQSCVAAPAAEVQAEPAELAWAAGQLRPAAALREGRAALAAALPEQVVPPPQPTHSRQWAALGPSQVVCSPAESPGQEVAALTLV